MRREGVYMTRRTWRWAWVAVLAGSVVLGTAGRASAQFGGTVEPTNPAGLTLRDPAITAGSGTGITVNVTGAVRTLAYKVTVSYTAMTCNATTCDVTLATLPAKAKVLGIVADLVTPFVCAQTCTTATLSITAGKTAGGAEYLASFDADAAAATFGDALAETGAALLVAAATQGGDLPSWSATTTLQIRMTSAVGNLATAGVTNLNAGSVTFYVATLVWP